MGGVDLADQSTSYANSQQKAWKHWYPKLFHWGIDQAVLNAGVIYEWHIASIRNNGRGLLMEQFQASLSRTLMKDSTVGASSTLEPRKARPGAYHEWQIHPGIHIAVKYYGTAFQRFTNKSVESGSAMQK